MAKSKKDKVKNKALSVGSLDSHLAVSNFFNNVMKAPDIDETLRKAGIQRHRLSILLDDDEIGQAAETRLDALLGAPYRLEPNDTKEAELLTQELNEWFVELASSAHNALFYGYSVQEAIYERKDTHIGLEWVGEKPMEWFEPKNDGRLIYRSESGFEGEVDQTVKFFLTRRKSTYKQPYGKALLATLYWLFFFKQNGFKFWAKFLERFGTPILLGKVKDGSDEDVQAMNDALLSAHAQSVISIDAEFSFEVVVVYAESGANTAEIDTVLDAKFSFDVVAVFSENTDVIGQIDTVLETSFSFEVEAVFSKNLCIIDMVLESHFQFEVKALFDINHLVGVSCGLNSMYYSAISRLGSIEIPWSKPILRVSNETLFYERGLVLSQKAFVGFDKSLTLSQSIRVEHEKATGLNIDAHIVWQSGDKRFIHSSSLFDESLKLRVNRKTDWQEMIRKRRNITYSHEVAQVFEKRFSFEWDKGLEIITKDDIAWDKAKAIHYRKHPIQPWPEPEIPEYVPSTDLNFNCLCHDVDSHNVVLNFGADDCIPAIPNKKGWYILNTLKVTRLDNGADITVFNGSYNTDRSRWCWSYSLTVPNSEITKLDPINSQPVILKIVVNSIEHHMLLESRSRSRSFANITWNLTGRSQTALLDVPYSAVRSFLQENERTSVQLVQAEIDRSSSQPNLSWKLIDDLGWIVANESLSYSNLSPIAAIKTVVESGGGFVYSEKGSNTLSIKPLYKKTFWDSLTFADYDRLIPESIVTSLSTDFELYPHYNAITLTNDRHALQAQVKRAGTAGDVLLPSENSPLFNHVSMGAFGKSKLARAGMVETHSLVMPINSEIGECAPGEILAFNAEWWGIIDSVNVSFTYSKVTQTVTVERTNHE